MPFSMRGCSTAPSAPGSRFPRAAKATCTWLKTGNGAIEIERGQGAEVLVFDLP
jgi:hypothetical protein